MVEESIKKGYQKTEVGIIPEDWDLEKINKVSIKLLSGGTPSTTNPEYWNGDIPWTRGAVLTQRYIDTGEHFISKNGLKNSASVLIPKHNLIVASRVSIGNLSINKIDIAINQDITGVIINKEKILVDYLYWYLFYFLNKIIAFSQGTSIQGFTRNELKEFLIALPSLPEQEKIVNILSNIDELIQQIDYLITKKKNIKQGAMQELLTGTKRLDGFNEKWIFTKLDEVAEMFSGGTPLTSNRSYYDGNIPWVIITDITKAKKYLYSTEKNITQQGLESCSAKIFQKGVLLFAMYASIGKCCIAKIDVTCNQAILGIVTKKIDTEFLYQHMVFSEKRFSQMGQTGTQNNLNKEMVQNLDIPYPHIDEQIAIGKILSDMDVEINELEKNRDKYVMIKNGMMQKLLTGEIRIK